MSAATAPGQALETILRTRVVPIIRTRSAEWAMQAAEILAAADFGVIEVTFTVPDASNVVARLRTRFPQILVGAGTVVTAATAEEAVASGAQFLLSPALSPGMVAVARRHGVLAVPGAYTPTEVQSALEGGAELVKIFPADSGGPAHIRAILAPLPRVRLLPTGGVRPDNVGEWFAAGAAAVGIGSALVGPGDRPVDPDAFTARIEELRRALPVPPRGGGRRSTV